MRRGELESRGEDERGDPGRCDVQFNVHPIDGTHIDESLFLGNTRMTVYVRVGIRTLARQVRASVRASWRFISL